ncbi:MAG: hypothetical protein QF535_05895, partial [Anaerolineales bacterium]|nr:hypothetical protein [Anaerolineales bacterium]
SYLIIILFIIYMFTYPNNTDEEKQARRRYILSTKRAILAIIISYLAHLDAIFAPFWIVWILSEYMEGWT